MEIQSSGDQVFSRTRIWIAAVLFVAIESVMIFGFGGSFYGDPDPGFADTDGLSRATVWIVSFIGYFLLGLISGTLRSWPIMILPLILAVGVGIPDDAVADIGSEPFPLFVSWFFALIAFVPTWAFGVLIWQALFNE